MIPPALRERLRAILGPSGLVEETTDLAPKLKDHRGRYVGRTPLALRPASTEALAAAMALLHAEGIAMVPQGGNTGLVGGATPDESGDQVLILTERMRAIRALDPAGDTITVEAGCTLAEVQAAAESIDRLYPVSLASQGSCTIGGNLSTNAGGVQVLRYGNTREQVLGLEVVLPDGRIWNGLRALRKDNTGYDLKQVFIGAEGTLGIITAAVLRLWPRPRARAVAFCAVPDVEAAVTLLARLRTAAGEALTAFELMPEMGLSFVLRYLPGSHRPLATVSPWYVLAEIAAQRDDPAPLLESALEAAMEDGLVQDATIAASESQALALWSLRESMSDAQKPEGASLKHDVSIPVPAIAQFVAEATAAVATRDAGVRLVCFGHVGDGNLHFNLSQPIGVEPSAFLARTAEFAEIIHDLVHAHQGSISAEHGLGRLKLDEITRYHSEVELDLKRRIKTAIDPRGLMNPGKLVKP
ncbi:FAD-binding oxidoreductase [Zavarzinia aquatilis]|uniref:Hydroxyacid dehydrogenase n=1 Tax=Zavarzinia aquatilis TaxID=2211142 RepID=A0A317E963_9PROT|nr:FAD-binding oxidoreductase [Zavarzinia aquatilis]PWR22834.1 hydroxyacid dehydrogenase [Zavarzinia aquatilis]